ncbi:phosphotransferase, partial [Armatimonas sp.]|uniref:phosphotransferase n=1 Tax=Armatimonas sp. TaxID=1872638 RepID=UPI00286A5FE2
MPTTSHDTPLFSLPAAEALVQEHYGLTLKATALPGEWDRNILLSDASGPVAVLKLSHAAQERGLLELENAALEHLTQQLPEIAFPRLLPAQNGQTLLSCTSESGTAHLTRLISYLPGMLYAHARPHDKRLLASLGKSLARVDLALAGFSHPQLAHSLKWDLSQALWIEAHLECVEAGEKRERIAAILADYNREFVPQQATLRKQALYNDANDYNILVQGGEVSGFIDLGDMVESALINELAIAAAYALMGQAAPLDAACVLVAAYHETLPLTEGELAVLWTLIQTRLAVSVVNSAIERTAHPENTYLAISEAPAWELLSRMVAISPTKAHYALRAACGLPAHPDTEAIQHWLAANTAEFAAIAPIDPRVQPSTLIDLSVGSLELGGGDRWSADEIEVILEAKRRDSGAELVLGRYLEPRLLYAFPAFDQPGLERTEHRTVHLGADLFLPHGTPVFAPLAGTVVSVVDNRGAGNYGPTVILVHQAGETGRTFFTLYGHLDPACLTSLCVGQHIDRGQCFAALGRREHNGGWPPHLHFQVLLDLLGCEGDFPGVARPAERALYAGVCPDPNLILGVPGGINGEPEGNASLLTRRHQSIGPSLSISYQEPLQIVRGYGQYLYTADGQAFL